MPPAAAALSAAQLDAVSHPGGALLIVGGAGTGKTSTLEERFAWLVSEGTSPDAILALSPTRPAAAAMRAALERGDWDEVGRQIATEWENRKRLAPGVTTPAIDDLIARARAAGATAAKVCGAGGGGCLFCYGPPDRRAAIAEALAAGGARLLDYTIERDGLTRG
jgi:galactokinase/mevalonate kinase-like predicted kinase